MPIHAPYCGSDQNAQAWDRKQGVSIRVGGNHLYANGALRGGSYGGAFVMQDPPIDPIEKQKRVILYWQKYVEQAVHEFEYRQNVLMHEVAGHTADAAVRELEERKKLAKDGRKQLKAAENELLRIQVGAKTVKEALEITEKRRIAYAGHLQNEEQIRGAARGRIANIKL